MPRPGADAEADSLPQMVDRIYVTPQATDGLAEGRGQIPGPGTYVCRAACRPEPGRQRCAGSGGEQDGAGTVRVRDQAATSCRHGQQGRVQLGRAQRREVGGQGCDTGARPPPRGYGGAVRQRRVETGVGCVGDDDDPATAGAAGGAA